MWKCTKWKRQISVVHAKNAYKHPMSGVVDTCVCGLVDQMFRQKLQLQFIGSGSDQLFFFFFFLSFFCEIMCA